MAFALATVVSVVAADVPVLNVAFFTYGQPMGDLEAIQSEVSKVTLSKLGVRVKLTPVNIGAWSQQVNLMLASGEPLDLMVTGVGTMLGFEGQVARNQLLPLDDLLSRHGAGIKASMDPEFLLAARVRGKIYAVPTVRDFAAEFGVNIRKSILDKYKVDIKSIKSYGDYTSFLRLVKEKEPLLIGTFPGTAGATMVQRMPTWDPLGDSFGVLMDYGRTLKVVNLFETTEYSQALKLVRSWYQAGYILKDVATNKDGWQVMVKANKLASLVSSRKPGLDEQSSREAGEPMVTTALLPARTTTSNVASIMWAIPRNSKIPEKAMSLLNLMYSDPEVINLLVWGIEGKHYVKTPDGRIDYPEGVTAKNTGWGLSMGWMFGNQLMSYIWKTDSPSLYKDLEAFNRGAVKSKALGFTFDASPVKTQYAAVVNVYNQYSQGLENGMLDIDATLPVFLQKLKAAGLEKVLAEKQRQLDAWAADNE